MHVIINKRCIPFLDGELFFDNEAEVIKLFGEWGIPSQLKNYTFVDSIKEPFVQISDCVVGMLSRLFQFMDGLDVKTTSVHSDFSPRQKNNLKAILELIDRSLITVVYRVLDKFAIENKTFAKITLRNRLERKLINPVALREAFINAVVHNDYSLGWPIIEFYSDHVTITSTGGLVEGLSQEDFFKGRSILRNRELIRVFKDVELVEELGSGMQHILKTYDHSVFEITPSFIVVTFPYANGFERS